MFNNLLLVKNKPHAIIISESHFSTIDKMISDFLKAIVCESTPYCNTCKWCEKINKKNYKDLVVVDGTNKIIKREELENVHNSFLMSGFEEKNIKFLIFKCCENATKAAINSMLKFTEESKPNVYFIFTTRNVSKVIPTLRSRFHTYFSQTDKNEISRIKNLYKLNDEQIEIIVNCYYNSKDFEIDYNSNEFNNLCIFANEILSCKNEYSKSKSLKEKFNNLNYFQIEKLLKILSIILRNKNNDMLDILNDLRLMPPKILIFNKLLELNN